MTLPAIDASAHAGLHGPAASAAMADRMERRVVVEWLLHRLRDQAMRAPAAVLVFAFAGIVIGGVRLSAAAPHATFAWWALFALLTGWMAHRGARLFEFERQTRVLCEVWNSPFGCRGVIAAEWAAQVLALAAAAACTAAGIAWSLRGEAAAFPFMELAAVAWLVLPIWPIAAGLAAWSANPMLSMWATAAAWMGPGRWAIALLERGAPAVVWIAPAVLAAVALVALDRVLRSDGWRLKQAEL